MVNAQAWLDENYPKEERKSITFLDISEKNLEGNLKLNGFLNLQEFDCYRNHLIELNLTDCGELVKINCDSNYQITSLILPINNRIARLHCGSNQLTELPANLNPQTLTLLDVNYNKFPTQDLTIFSHFVNLEELGIVNNQFTGSLEILVKLTKLKGLDIINTKIDSGFEYLPEGLRRFNCEGTKLIDELKDYKGDYQQDDRWRGLLKAIQDSWTTKFATLQTEYQQLKEETTTQQKTLLSQIPHKPTLLKLIGEGGFARVYRATLNNEIIAVKQSKVSLNNISERELRDLEAEVHLLEKLRNKHIIQYYGIYQDETDFFIMMEYAKHGTLTDFIQGTKTKPTDWEINYNLIQHMTRGLSYLHSNQIIHRDLKSMNVLVTDGYLAKIADFGLSQVIDNLTISKTASKGVSGTARWMAPELLTKKKQHTAYSDIYALGMIIWEITSKKTVPFDYAESSLDVLLCHLRGEKEEIPTNAPAVLKEIINGCWEDNPSERISLTEINNKIEEVLKLENNSVETTILTQVQSELNNSEQAAVVEYETELNFFIEQPPK